MEVEVKPGSIRPLSSPRSMSIAYRLRFQSLLVIHRLMLQENQGIIHGVVRGEGCRDGILLLAWVIPNWPRDDRSDTCSER